jgi:hypothetical protein
LAVGRTAGGRCDRDARGEDTAFDLRSLGGDVAGRRIGGNQLLAVGSAIGAAGWSAARAACRGGSDGPNVIQPITAPSTA